MEIRIFKNHKIASEAISHLIIDGINRKGLRNLGLATGSTYIYTYYLLRKAFDNHEISFKNITTFNLDEYLDIDASHPQTYRNFMYKHLFNYVNINDENVYFPPTQDKVDYKIYDKLILDKGGIGLQILGIGENGHIAFNEPGTPFSIKTHKIELTDSTRQANKRFFNHQIDQVPKYAITMGIDTIMQSKRVIVTAFGLNKAQAIYRMIKGLINEKCPASILQKHPDVKVFLDEEAASYILKGDVLNDNIN
jgi:glucosamine-6-phosphate deaminase